MALKMAAPTIVQLSLCCYWWLCGCLWCGVVLVCARVNAKHFLLASVMCVSRCFSIFLLPLTKTEIFCFVFCCVGIFTDFRFLSLLSLFLFFLYFFFLSCCCAVDLSEIFQRRFSEFPCRHRHRLCLCLSFSARKSASKLFSLFSPTLVFFPALSLSSFYVNNRALARVSRLRSRPLWLWPLPMGHWAASHVGSIVFVPRSFSLIVAIVVKCWGVSESARLL